MKYIIYFIKMLDYLMTNYLVLLSRLTVTMLGCWVVDVYVRCYSLIVL